MPVSASDLVPNGDACVRRGRGDVAVSCRCTGGMGAMTLPD
jgi:hypothetical protein